MYENLKCLLFFRYGGGGGGYAGGNGGGAMGDHPIFNTTYGEGGYSFLNPNKIILDLSKVHAGGNPGPGFVMIIPETDGCNCDYKCVALDIEMSEIGCVCPRNWKLAENKNTCIGLIVEL